MVHLGYLHGLKYFTAPKFICEGYTCSASGRHGLYFLTKPTVEASVGSWTELEGKAQPKRRHSSPDHHAFNPVTSSKPQSLGVSRMLCQCLMDDSKQLATINDAQQGLVFDAEDLR